MTVATTTPMANDKQAGARNNLARSTNLERFTNTDVLPISTNKISRLLIRDAPDVPRTGLNDRRFLNWLEAQIRSTAATGFPGIPNGIRGSDLAVFPGIRTRSSHRLPFNARPSKVLRWRCGGCRHLERRSPPFRTTS